MSDSHAANASRPVTLDPPIALTMLMAGSTPARLFVDLAKANRVPMGVESPVGPPRDRPDAPPATVRKPIVTFWIEPGSLSTALRAVFEYAPGFEVSTRNGLVSIAPAAVARASDHFMNVSIGQFEADDITIYRAVAKLRHRLNSRYKEQDYPPSTVALGRTLNPRDVERRTATKALMDRHVTLSLEHATPREVLDCLVAQHRELVWVVTYQARSPYDQAHAIEADWFIDLVPFEPPASAAMFAPIRESVPVGPPIR
jgi:hypothetical protein